MEIDKAVADRTTALVKKTEDTILTVKVTNQKELDTAKDLLLEVSRAKKAVTDTERSFLDPLNQSRNKIIEFFKPLKEKLVSCESAIKKEMLGYMAILDKKEDVKKQEVEKKIATGELSLDQANKEIMKIEIKKEGVNYRTDRKVIIDDAEKLPRKYLMPNEVLIRKDALAGVKIPGVKVEEVKNIVAK